MIIGSKLRSLEGGKVAFMCPGCQTMHAITIEKGKRPCWGYNDNPDAPTFTPSILVKATERLDDDEIARIQAGEKIEPIKVVCHSFVTDGMIRFLTDCTHAMAGQTVPLPDLIG